MVSELEHELEAAMVRIAGEAKDLGYNPTYFLRMIHEIGGLRTAKQLVLSATPSDGFLRLWEMGRLDLTVEALLLQPRFRTLVTAQEALAARKRLAEYGYEI